MLNRSTVGTGTGPSIAAWTHCSRPSLKVQIVQDIRPLLRRFEFGTGEIPFGLVPGLRRKRPFVSFGTSRLRDRHP